jgi:hypothetical protein
MPSIMSRKGWMSTGNLDKVSHSAASMTSAGLPSKIASRRFSHWSSASGVMCDALGPSYQFIGASAPDVDGPDGALLLLGHELGAEVEGLGVLAGHLVASLVGFVEHLRRDAGRRYEQS